MGARAPARMGDFHRPTLSLISLFHDLKSYLAFLAIYLSVQCLFGLFHYIYLPPVPLQGESWMHELVLEPEGLVITII